MDTETAILEDTGTIILTTLINYIWTNQNDHNIPRQPNIEPRRTNEERQRVGETHTQPNVESSNGSQQPKN